MTDADRDRLRRKQDRILKLAKGQGFAKRLRISADYPGSPTLGELETFLFPKWEAVIDDAIQYLERVN